MNCAMKAAVLNSNVNCMCTRAALFHSTPVLDRRRRNYWETRNNYYSKKFRKLHAKQSFLHKVNAYADFMFQSWRDELHEDYPFSSRGTSSFKKQFSANGSRRNRAGNQGDELDEDDPFSSRGTSWFKKQFSANGSRRNRASNQGSWYCSRRGFNICEDDDEDVQNIFQSAFGGNQFFYWSFINEENPQWRSSSNYHGRSWNWRHQNEEEYESYHEYGSSESDTASDRLALGLNASGPLTIEDVKNAYRTCALKWHPDRHQGSSKVVAEEKFKLCSAAYQSLCDKLIVD